MQDMYAESCEDLQCAVKTAIASNKELYQDILSYKVFEHMQRALLRDRVV